MLVYHAFADINHGIFRAFVLQRYVFGERIEIDYWRILDFIYLFPHKAESLSVPRGLVSRKRQLSELYSKYNDVPFPREFLAETLGIHATIASVLSAKGVIGSDELKQGQIDWRLRDWPSELAELAARRASDDDAVLSFLKDLREQVPVSGPQGIKVRSDWMEHRYDA